MRKIYSIRYGVQKIKTKTALLVSATALAVAGTGGLSLALLGVSHADPTTVVVAPGNMQGWAFFDDNGNGGSGSLVSGPATPPLGSGSAQLEVNASNQGYALGGTSNGGTPLSALTTVSYSTYVQQGNDTIAPALQFNVDQDVTDTNNAYQGRLVYEPYQNGTVTDGQWQSWNALSGKWWLSKSGTLFNNNCSQAAPCTFADLESLYPNIGILNGAGNVVFKAGSGWTVPFIGNVDALTLGTSTNTTTFDFEPSVTDTVSTPSITSPANGAEVTSAQLTSIDWTNSTATYGPVTYQYRAYSDPTYKSLVYDSGNTLTSSEIPTPGTPDGVYYVQVRAFDSYGVASDWSNDASNPYKITVRELVSPANADQCKNDGWMTFNNPTFKNQGDCVSWVQHNVNGNGTPAANKPSH